MFVISLQPLVIELSGGTASTENIQGARIFSVPPCGDSNLEKKNLKEGKIYSLVPQGEFKLLWLRNKHWEGIELGPQRFLVDVRHTFWQFCPFGSH